MPIMRKFDWVGAGLISVAVTLGVGRAAIAGAPDRWEFQGVASTGEKVYLNLDSIQLENRGNGYFFTYQIASDRPLAYTPCDGRFQVADANGVTFGAMMRPQSPATQAMLRRVCGRQAQEPAQSAYVFAPPSNVRATPNGDVLCAVTSPTTIRIYGNQGQWFSTDFCGRMGVIHSSQIRR